MTWARSTRKPPKLWKLLDPENMALNFICTQHNFLLSLRLCGLICAKVQIPSIASCLIASQLLLILIITPFRIMLFYNSPSLSSILQLQSYANVILALIYFDFILSIWKAFVTFTWFLKFTAAVKGQDAYDMD